MCAYLHFNQLYRSHQSQRQSSINFKIFSDNKGLCSRVPDLDTLPSAAKIKKISL